MTEAKELVEKRWVSGGPYLAIMLAIMSAKESATGDIAVVEEVVDGTMDRWKMSQRSAKSSS